MASSKKKYPHYRLEHPTTDLGVAQTSAGYRLVEPAKADRFPTHTAALLASGAQPVNVVRVDA